MKKMVLEKKDWIVLAALSILAAFFTVGYQMYTGNSDQVFTDIVMERTAQDQSNKSAEMNLTWGLIFGGILTLALMCLKFIKKYSKSSDAVKSAGGGYDVGEIMLLFSGVSVLMGGLLYADTNPLHLAAVCVGLVLWFIDRSLIYTGLTFFYLCFYGLCGLYRLYVTVLTSSKSCTATVFIIFSAVLTLALSALKKRKMWFHRGSLLVQLCIPFILMAFHMNVYLYEGRRKELTAVSPATWILYMLVAFCLLNAIATIRKKWDNRNAGAISGVVSLGSCIAIMAINCFDDTGAILSQDLHHPFENIIGYSQIYELGQSAYAEYIPPSGLYSVLAGFVLKHFGLGMMANYNLCMNLINIGSILWMLVLLDKQLDRRWVFIISLFMMGNLTSRVFFIMPIMLLLTLPKLLKRPKTWICIWFLSTYLHGIYYPLYGAAVGIALLPLGIWQLYKVIKELRSDRKARKQCVLCLLMCVVSVLFGIPILYGTLKHTLAMAGQTIFADGISIFAQEIPENFLPYISGFDASFIRIAAWNILRVLIPVFIVWVAFWLLCIFVKQCDRKSDFYMEKVGVIASIVIMPVISYSYALVRMDSFNLLSRAVYPVVFAAVLLLGFVVSHVTDSKSKLALMLLLFVVLNMADISGRKSDPEFVFADRYEKALENYYEVPEDYLYVSAKNYRLGECFVNKDVLKNIEYFADRIAFYDRSQSYFAVFPSFGYTYTLNLKGSSLIEAVTVKGYDAACETVELLREQKSLVGRSFNTYQQYYLYYYLMTSGEYYYDPELLLFVPASEKLDANKTKQYNMNANMAAEDLDVKTYASSLGLSMDTLMPIFSSYDGNYSIHPEDSELRLSFEDEFDDKDFDFLYIDFKNVADDISYVLYSSGGVAVEKDGNRLARLLMKKRYNAEKQVVVNYNDEAGRLHSIRCDLSKGKLLIPLGAGAGYLLNEHDTISVYLEQNGTRIALPEINEIRMLKLQEIG